MRWPQPSRMFTARNTGTVFLWLTGGLSWDTWWNPETGEVAKSFKKS